MAPQPARVAIPERRCPRDRAPQAGPVGRARASLRVLLDGDRRLKHGLSIQSGTVSSVSGADTAPVAETACRARCCCLRRLRLSRSAAAWRWRCSAWLRRPDSESLGALFGGSFAMAECCDASRGQVKPGERRPAPASRCQKLLAPAWRRAARSSTMRANSFASRAPRRASINLPIRTLRRAILNLLESQLRRQRQRV